METLLKVELKIPIFSSPKFLNYTLSNYNSPKTYSLTNDNSPQKKIKVVINSGFYGLFYDGETKIGGCSFHIFFVATKLVAMYISQPGY